MSEAVKARAKAETTPAMPSGHRMRQDRVRGGEEAAAAAAARRCQDGAL